MADFVRDNFVVRFPEGSVECFSLEDAEALQSAHDVLSDHLGREPSCEECELFFGGEIPYRRLDAVDGIPYLPVAQSPESTLAHAG